MSLIWTVPVFPNQGVRLWELGIRSSWCISAGLRLSGRRQRLGLGCVWLRSQSLVQSLRHRQQIQQHRGTSQAAACRPDLGRVRRRSPTRGVDRGLQGAGQERQQQRVQEGQRSHDLHAGQTVRPRGVQTCRHSRHHHEAGDAAWYGVHSEEGDVAVQTSPEVCLHWKQEGEREGYDVITKVPGGGHRWVQQTPLFPFLFVIILPVLLFLWLISGRKHKKKLPLLQPLQLLTGSAVHFSFFSFSCLLHSL